MNAASFNTPPAPVQRRPRKRTYRRTIDLLALVIIGVYAIVACNAQFGSRFAIAPLDPIWTEIQWRGTLRVATDVGFRPFADDRDGNLVGYDIDLARAVASQMGLEVEFVPTGFDALYDALTSRKADMIASALPYAPELSHRARFSTFYFDAGQVLVVPETSAIQGTDDLSEQQLGVALGSNADAYARQLVEANPRISLNSTYETVRPAMADLRQGKLDAVITDNVSALIAVQSRPGLRIAQALTSEPYALAVPPEAFQLQAEVNRALDMLRQEDFFTGLNQRWFTEP